ncbi:hypothetical protein [Microcoleus sp. EPA2]|uniref:hypothetical protein n=1 Tax=Microcoleus sp. EPA2 TaxID=2841654 RepID=UPI00312B8BB9
MEDGISKKNPPTPPKGGKWKREDGRWKMGDGSRTALIQPFDLSPENSILPILPIPVASKTGYFIFSHKSITPQLLLSYCCKMAIPIKKKSENGEPR